MERNKKNAIDDHGKAQQKADIRYVIMYPNCPSFEVACSLVISFEVRPFSFNCSIKCPSESFFFFFFPCKALISCWIFGSI